MPTLLDLVSFPVRAWTNADFNSIPLLTRSPFNILSSDINHFVRIDVTSLMAEAQRLGLRNLQLRFLLDFVPRRRGWWSSTTAWRATAPLLTVEFR